MAVLIKAEDCQGCEHIYYRATRTSSRGDIVLGCGGTEAEAEAAADSRLKELETFLALDPKTQLAMLCRQPQLSQRDVEHAIRLLARLISTL